MADPKDYAWCGYARAVVGGKDCVRGIMALWGSGRGAKAALAAHRMFLIEEDREEKTENGCPEKARKRRGKIEDPNTGEWKTRVGMDARRVREERQRGGRLPLAVILGWRVRCLTDGAVIGRKEFVKNVRGGQGEPKHGKSMRFREWGGLRALRNLRPHVVGG